MFKCAGVSRLAKSRGKKILLERLKELLTEIHSSSCDTHIVSSEYFPGIDENDIKYYHDILTPSIDLHIIVYL